MLFRFSRLKGRPLECVAWRNIYYLYWLGAVLKRLREAGISEAAQVRHSGILRQLTLLPRETWSSSIIGSFVFLVFFVSFW